MAFKNSNKIAFFTIILFIIGTAAVSFACGGKDVIITENPESASRNDSSLYLLIRADNTSH